MSVFTGRWAVVEYPCGHCITSESECTINLNDQQVVPHRPSASGVDSEADTTGLISVTGHRSCLNATF